MLDAVAACLIGYAVLGANRPNVFGTVVGACLCELHENTANKDKHETNRVFRDIVISLGRGSSVLSREAGCPSRETCRDPRRPRAVPSLPPSARALTLTPVAEPLGFPDVG